MKINKAIKLLKQFAVCPQCGNGKVGPGEGVIRVNGNKFERTYRCEYETKLEVKEV
jgi:hypothetical protein